MKDTAENRENEWQQSFDWDRTVDITAEEVSGKDGWSYLTKEQAEETAYFIRIMGMLISHVMIKQQYEVEKEAKIIRLNTNETNNKAA